MRSCKHTFDVVMVIPGMPFSGDSLKKHSLGGSETCGLELARSLVALGNRVTMFSQCDQRPASGPGVYDEVIYRPLSEAFDYIKKCPHDIFITQRWPNVLSTRVLSRMNIVWNHDLALKRNKVSYHSTMWNTDAIVTVSRWHAKQQQEIYGLPSDVFWPIHNGIDVESIPFNPDGDKYKLVYGARPERGLVNLVKPGGVMEILLKMEPKFHLYVAGYDNTVPEMEHLYKYMWGRIDKLSNCTNLGHLTKEELYKHYASAGMYVYPQNFEEVFCLSVAECLASGTVFVSNEVGSIPEVAAGHTQFVRGDAGTENYQRAFANMLVQLSNEDIKRHDMAVRGREFVKKYNWPVVAGRWMAKFHEFFEKMTADRGKLRRHFLYNEDIEAAKHVSTDSERHVIEADYKWAGNFDDWNYFYRDQFFVDRESSIKSIDEVLNTASGKRLNFMLNFIKRNKEDIKTVVDFGSDIGAYTFNMAKRFPDIDFIGVEMVEAKVELAERLNKSKSGEPIFKNVKFVIGDANRDLSHIGKADLVMACEVLEHFPRPWEAMNNIELLLNIGGHAVITVPFGPWDKAAGKNGNKYKGHFWEFDRHDLRDMFGERSGFTIIDTDAGNSDTDGAVLGWHFVEYRKTDNTPVGEINMERKCFIQSPRDTLSVCMIVKNAESMLHRTLKSVQIADEIIVVDTGSTDSTKEIASKYTDIVLDGPDPLKDGFDAARNFGLKKATGDWVLWIDSDEELVDSVELYKYLRNNYYNGYVIRQHHFSVIPSIAVDADEPIRVFRNRKKIEFWGLVHEHPHMPGMQNIEPIVKISDVGIAHDGFLSERVRKDRFDRNIKLLLEDRKKYPDREIGDFLMMRDYCQIARYELMQNSGVITEEVKSNCENVISIYRSKFLGKGATYEDQGLQYYTEALAIMSRGFEVSVQLAAAMSDIRPGSMVLAKFADSGDLMAYLRSKVRQITSDLEGDYV